MSYENWQRSYKVTIGVPEKTLDAYTTSVLFTDPTNRGEDQITIPSRAVTLSNLASEGKNLRGFTFKLDAIIAGGNNVSNKSESTVLELFNVDQEIIDLLEQKECVVRVWAGYGDKVSLAYAGDVVEVKGVQQSNDFVQRVSCRCGDADFRNSIMVADYLEDKSVAEILKDIIKRFPSMALGTSDLKLLEDVYEPSGWSWQGSTVEGLQHLITKYNLTISTQSGKIYVYPYKIQDYSNDFLFGDSGNNYQLTSDLIKDIQPINNNNTATSVDNKDVSGVSVNTFYIPIEIGQFFTIPKRNPTNPAENNLLDKYNGTYKVDKIRVKLESHGTFWDVSVSGTRI